MKLTFTPKYGINHLELPLNDGSFIKTDFFVKYGYNKVIFATKPQISIEFNLKYGKNYVDVEIPDNAVVAWKDKKYTNLFGSKVTIYNDIPSDGVNARRFDRFVIDLCNIQNGILQSADGTIEKVVNAQTITTKDIEHYKTPLEYALLPADMKDNYFTANVNDFVVLAEVDDIVTTSREFQDLQSKYKNNGFSVTAVNEYIHGMAVDNVQIIHA